MSGVNYECILNKMETPAEIIEVETSVETDTERCCSEFRVGETFGNEAL